MSVKRVVLIRPGETDWNKIGRWQGIVAVPLNMHGIKQAQRLAKFVRNIGLDVIYSSDVRRARDTAAVLSEYANVPIHYDARLRERHLGLWQGLSMNEMRDWYKKQYDELMSDPVNTPAPEGESRAQVAERVTASFNDILKTEYETIGIITHTTAIRVLLSQLIPDSNPFEMQFRNISVTTIASDDNKTWSLTQLDDVTHLDGMVSHAFTDRIGLG
ncbi:MAG: histidine phosphatase family protein [Phototrophicaceae bacterium]